MLRLDKFEKRNFVKECRENKKETNIYTKMFPRQYWTNKTQVSDPAES
jgi:hypothetical protein